MPQLIWWGASAYMVVQLITLSIPTWVEVELGCDNEEIDTLEDLKTDCSNKHLINVWSCPPFSSLLTRCNTGVSRYNLSIDISHHHTPTGLGNFHSNGYNTPRVCGVLPYYWSLCLSPGADRVLAPRSAYAWLSARCQLEGGGCLFKNAFWRAKNHPTCSHGSCTT